MDGTVSKSEDQGQVETTAAKLTQLNHLFLGRSIQNPDPQSNQHIVSYCMTVCSAVQPQTDVYANAIIHSRALARHTNEKFVFHTVKYVTATDH